MNSINCCEKKGRLDGSSLHLKMTYGGTSYRNSSMRRKIKWPEREATQIPVKQEGLALSEPNLSIPGNFMVSYVIAGHMETYIWVHT